MLINNEDIQENTIICDSNLKNISNPTFLELYDNSNSTSTKNPIDTKIQLLKYLEYNTSRDEILNNKKLHVLYKNKDKISSNCEKSSKIKTNMNQLMNENRSLNLFMNIGENKDPFSLKSLNACKNNLKTNSIKDLDKENFRIYSNFNKTLKKPVQNVTGLSSLKSLNKTIQNYNSIYEKTDDDIIFSINKIPVKNSIRIKNMNL